MQNPPDDARLWESCRTLIDDSRRARAALQSKWDALLEDRKRVGDFGIAFLAEASARLAATGQVQAPDPPPTAASDPPQRF